MFGGLYNIMFRKCPPNAMTLLEGFHLTDAPPCHVYDYYYYCYIIPVQHCCRYEGDVNDEMSVDGGDGWAKSRNTRHHQSSARV